jgi:hypothetical protein
LGLKQGKYTHQHFLLVKLNDTMREGEND